MTGSELRLGVQVNSEESVPSHEKEPVSDPLSVIEHGAALEIEVVRQCRRAAVLRWGARGILIAILSLIVAGVYVFGLAPQLAKGEVREDIAKEALANLYEQRVEILEQQARLTSTTIELVGQRQDMKTQLVRRVREARELLSAAETELNAAKDGKTFVPYQFALLEGQVQFAKSALEKWQVSLDTLPAIKDDVETLALVQQYVDRSLANTDMAINQLISASQSVVDTNLLVHTNVTRFGTLTVIIFVVGLLMTLYRYNVRLASFYDARADTFRILTLGVTVSGLETVAAAMTPMQEFPRPPRSPLDQVTQIAAKAPTKS